MMDSNSKRERDIMDVSSSAQEDGRQDRPMVTPDTGRFFLDQFLEEEEEPVTVAPTVQMAPMDTDTSWPEGVEEGDLKGAIIAKLQGIFDPEIPVNIYELGLIYEINIDDFDCAEVLMTLTTPHCPVAESMPGDVEIQVGSVPGVKGVEVKLVWEPPWDMSRMSDEARLELGLL